MRSQSTRSLKYLLQSRRRPRLCDLFAKVSLSASSVAHLPFGNSVDLYFTHIAMLHVVDTVEAELTVDEVDLFEFHGSHLPVPLLCLDL